MALKPANLAGAGPPAPGDTFVAPTEEDDALERRWKSLAAHVSGPETVGEINGGAAVEESIMDGPDREGRSRVSGTAEMARAVETRRRQPAATHSEFHGMVYWGYGLKARVRLAEVLEEDHKFDEALPIYQALATLTRAAYGAPFQQRNLPDVLRHNLELCQTRIARVARGEPPTPR